MTVSTYRDPLFYSKDSGGCLRDTPFVTRTSARVTDNVSRRLFRWSFPTYIDSLDMSLTVTLVGLVLGLLTWVLCNVSVGILPFFRVGLFLFKSLFFLSIE